jgi:hypothetical protein
MKHNINLSLLFIILIIVIIIIYSILQKNRQEHFGIISEIGCFLNKCNIVKCKAGLLICKGCNICKPIY